MEASSQVRKSVAYGCGVGRSTEKWLCQFPRNDLVVLLDISINYFISRINWVNKTTSKKEEIIKTICDLVNHIRFPKEDHLPDWARRDNKVTKGDRVWNFLHFRMIFLLQFGPALKWQKVNSI